MRNEVDQSGRHKMFVTRTGMAVQKKMRSAQLASCVGILIGAVFSSASVQAESFDGVKVHSALNEPLHAQLALHGNSQLQPGCAKANIESIEGEPLGVAEVRIVNDGGTQTMMLSTRDAIREPAVNVVVQTSCGSQEEHVYPALLDFARPERSTAAAHIPAISNPLKASTALAGPALVDAQPNEQISSESQAEGGIKLQLARSLSGLNVLSAGMVVAAESVMNGGDSGAQTQEARSVALASVEAGPSMVGAEESDAINKMRHYWQPVLGLCAALMGMLVLSFLRDARRVKSYTARKVVKSTAAKPAKARVKTQAQSTALDPIPYTKPDMTLFAAPITVSPRAPINRESQSSKRIAVSAPMAQADNLIVEDLSAKLPLYNAEEVVDEAQLAKLCLGLNQPLQAIEILEAYWGQKQPNTPLPWQCLLELYKITGDLNKYRELIGRFNGAFGDNAGKRNERTEENRRQYDALPDEGRRMRA